MTEPINQPLEGSAIDEALAFCIARAETEEGIPLEEALASLGPASFCFLCILLSVPFIQPLPLGPYTMASGITFIAAGWQMARGKESLTLPEKMRGLRMHGKGWVMALRLCQRLFRFCRKFTRRRCEKWVRGDQGTRRIGWLIFTGGALLAIPVANLPFNNTLPALMIIFASLAWLERDGLMIFISLFWGGLTLLYFAGVVVLLWIFGSQVFEWMNLRAFFSSPTTP